MPPLPTSHPARQSLRALLCGFAQIFLQQSPGCGLLVLIAILIGAPDLLPGALLGGLTSMLIAQHRGYPPADIAIGLYGYNGILLGLLLSLKLPWTPLLPVLIITSAALSSLLLAPWMRSMRKHGWLPAFTFPFVLLGWLLLALVTQLQLPLAAPTSSPSAPELNFLQLMLAVLRGLGQVIFLDSPLAGLCLLIGLRLADGRTALWALLGSSGGFALAIFSGWPGEGALAGLYGYNATLAAIALAQVHRSPLIPALGILLALLLQPGFNALGLPALTMPFILACWLIRAGTQSWQKAVKDSTPRV
ncbi:urea transporter [Ectopseudomonas toyotomiensis]|uniref:Urea transporter n=1 Tax=Ectopseudomonas toyotomiensis TaxID=554344 RepID=A0A1I5UHQ6_9GAMM|nr:urea transporter [Pseudomonas toyotomiensis]PIA73189.1 urea transporter [Pseudomonas toyotomiensis]SFP94577.1 urea transporter [Pseudomonas toyotomiensis]